MHGMVGQKTESTLALRLPPGDDNVIVFAEQVMPAEIEPPSL